MALITTDSKQHESHHKHECTSKRGPGIELDDIMINRPTLLNAHNDTIINRYNGLLGRKHITVFGHIVGLCMDYCQKIYKLFVYFGRCSSKLYKLAHGLIVHLRFTICIWLNSVKQKKCPVRYTQRG